MVLHYEVQILGEVVGYGTSRANAINYARRMSTKHELDTAYVVVSEDGEQIGHIAYIRGVRDHVEGRVSTH